MADRKVIPDIMGGLLNGSASRKAPSEPAGQLASETASQEPGLPAEQLARKPARQPRAKPAKQQPAAKPPAPPADEEKSKVTFYLSQEAIDALEDGWLQLRRLARERASVSKSGIVEQALLIALEELAGKGDESELAKRMAKQ